MELHATDLFESQVIAEAQKLAIVEVDRILRDPARLQSILLERTRELDETKKQLEEVELRWKRFFDSDGLIDAATVSAHLRIPYIAPDGKTRPMGRNYVLTVFEIDGIVLRSPSGYRLTSRWEKSGYGVTRIKAVNNVMRSVALFNSDGLRRLTDKYEHDQRVWKSGTDRGLWHE